jgi:hypothetical protein
MEHDEQADRMERVADDMEKQSEKLEQEIDDVREDWHSKQTSTTVPGAVEEGAAAPGGAGEPADDDRVDEGEGENPAAEDGGPA